jgi:hypothetical protein
MAHTTDLLLDTITPATKYTLLESIWGLNAAQLQKDDNALLIAYWQYYQATCAHALHDGGRHNLARTHQDIIELIGRMRNGDTRDDLRVALQSKLSRIHHDEEEILDSTIDLAASLLLMIDFGNAKHGFSSSRQLEWCQGSLWDCLITYFSARRQLGHDGVKLPRTFNARNLDKIAGVEFVPTTNLLDHLRLTDDDTKVYVFHHVAFLKLQSQRYIIANL